MDEYRKTAIENGIADPDHREEMRAAQAALEAPIKRLMAPLRNSMDNPNALAQARRADFLLSGYRRSFIWFGILNGAHRRGHQNVEEALDAAIELGRQPVMGSD